MKDYLRYLYDLYLDYMKLALSGLVLSAILLSLHSLIATSNLSLGIVVLVVVFSGIVLFATLTWRRHVAVQKEQNQQKLRELQRRGDEALAQRAEKRMDEARHYLKFMRTRGIKDYRSPSEESSLLNDMALLIERLQVQHVRQSSIEDALDRFLNVLDENGVGLPPDARRRILNSIVSDILVYEHAQKQESQRFIS